MILVGQYDSPYVRRVAITLHHYGMAFRRNPISVFSDADEMRRINPLVRIPSLVLEEGEVLIDSAAILDYLDERAGPKALVPGAGAERRHVLQVMAVASGTTDKVGAYVYERHFHEPANVNRQWLARLKGQAEGGLQWLENRLSGDWFFDGRLSQADITTGVLLGYLHLRVQDMLGHGRYPRLEAHSKRCEALPAFMAARPSPDEVMPPTGEAQ
jgi:glutathione S-transferase